VTCTAPVNIAVIKYWGKRDEKLILPLNSSLSGTLHQETLRTQTTVMASEKFTEDEIILNGKKEDIQNPRLQTVLREIRRRATKDIKELRVKIVSVNNFPTAAGLASSASGYCCLVFALAKLFGVDGDISSIARVGSGSACRSMYGGFVKWEMGSSPDGSDSLAIQVAPETHWPEMQVLVLVVNDNRKDTSSTEGMQKTANTCDLMEYRCKYIVPRRMEAMEKAIAQKNYQVFGDLTMRDSDDFHAVCAATQPPIYYLNDVSRKVIQLVHKYNELCGEIKVAYTFDAGPNACLYLPRDNVVPVLAWILKYFPDTNNDSAFFRGSQELADAAHKYVPPENLKLFYTAERNAANSLRYILHTRIGPGPQVLSDDSQHLIDPATGEARLVSKL
jgi:diphosphomevalonate decarboxylase